MIIQRMFSIFDHFRSRHTTTKEKKQEKKQKETKKTWIMENNMYNYRVNNNADAKR